jgi:acyl-CoA thioesterase I
MLSAGRLHFLFRVSRRRPDEVTHIRNLFYFSIAITGTILQLSAVGISEESPVQVQSSPVIVALGDSVTYGVRADHSVLPDQIFTSRLEHMLNPDFPGLTVINAGVPGNDTEDLLHRLNRDVLEKRPDLLIVMIGINDSAYVDPGPIARREPRVPLTEFKKNILEIIDRVESTGARVLLVTPNPISRAYLYSNLGYYRDHDMNAALGEYVKMLVSVAASRHIPLVDVYGTWKASAGYTSYLVDGIHPNSEGHAQIAGMLANGCRMLLAKPKTR